MKLDNYKRQAYQILFLFCALQLAGCDKKPKDENVYMIQCIDRPAANSQSKLFETKFNGNIANCHALLWRIPEKHSPNHGEFTTDFNEFISKRVVIDKPPTNVLPLWKTRKQQEVEISLEPYWERPGESLMVTHKNTVIGVFQLEKVEENFNGWEVYDRKDKLVSQRTVFSKLKPVEYFLSCGGGTALRNYKNTPEKAVCSVETFVDGRVYAKYTVLYENIGEMDKINNAVIQFAKSLMLN